MGQTEIDREGLQDSIDLRWEVAAPPTAEMWQAMRNAPIAMADFGEDASVLELEARGASLTGHEASLLVPTVTAGTVLSMMEGAPTGTVVLVESRSHIHWVEQMHISAICGASPRLVQGDKFGAIPLDALEFAVAEEYYGHRQPVSLLCLENTHNICGGTILTPAYIAETADWCRRHDISLFLDGARLFNAAVALGVDLEELASPVDYVVVALNKGLGAPFGALLCGSRDFIANSRARARRLGFASIHKAGIYAAAGLVALETMVERLNDDHARAGRLAAQVALVPGLSIDFDTVQTNLVRVEISPELQISSGQLAESMKSRGLKVHAFEPMAFKYATHFEITDADITRAAEITRDVIGQLTSTPQIV